MHVKAVLSTYPKGAALGGYSFCAELVAQAISPAKRRRSFKPAGEVFDSAPQRLVIQLCEMSFMYV